MTVGLGQVLVLAAYYAVLVLLAVYGVHRAAMLRLYYRHRHDGPRAAAEPEPLPRVTVQLPIYNEVYVVERLLEAVAAFDYPRELLEIQVLDDSTDETVEVARGAAQRLRERGWDAAHLRRPNRAGFKAGALQEGLRAAKGELVLVFDADFVPPAGFLRRCLPHFADPRVGLVQARWDHLNRDYSLLTRVQSILLDGHFVVEHTARHRSGRFFNFNGTAGIWRRRCLEDCGGWESDTLTEDLDVSYRAQLRGWRFVYLQDCVAPAEVPVDVHGFKSQQHRWAKGSIQTARKMLPRVLRARLPARVKLEAVFHLTGNASHPLLLLLALSMLPAIAIRERVGWQRLIALDYLLFFGAMLSFLAFYVCSQREIGRPLLPTLGALPAVLALGVGLSVHNTHAVLDGLRRRPAEFARTPKYRIEGRAGEWRTKAYRSRRGLSGAFEALLAACYAAAIVAVIQSGHWIALPFLLVLFGAFAFTAALSLAPDGASRGRRSESREPAAPRRFPIAEPVFPSRAELE